MSHSSQPNLGERIFQTALDGLTAEQQDAIREHLVSKTTEIRAAVDEAYSAAEQKKRWCEQKRWKWQFRQRTFVLVEEADKVLHWLDKFKTVGDTAAAAFPVHFGLPWAGISLLLQTAVHERDKVAALLTGMDFALSLANRLKVYMDHLDKLPLTLATTNFENALAKMYTRMLQFIATAIGARQRNMILRAAALWRESDLENFEDDIDQLSIRTEIEASNCDRFLDEQHWKDMGLWKADLNAALQKLDSISGIQNSLDRLQLKADLSKLTTAKGADHKSFENRELGKCLDGTRTELLMRIKAWANDPASKCIFWLHGMAGTGKSTISRTVAAYYDERKQLGASFFFQRNEKDRGNARRLFPTIAIQLADLFPNLSHSIADALENDSSLAEGNLQEQFDKLLSLPLANLKFDQYTHSTMLIVLDALDECNPISDVKTILGLLARLPDEVRKRLRILITSRPDLPIQVGFRRFLGDLHDEIVLEDVQRTSIENDIRTYFMEKLKEIREEDWEVNTYDPLPNDWPGMGNIKALVELAVPLFIFASTVCRFISQSDPEKGLCIILERLKYTPALPLAEVYRTILDQMVSCQEIKRPQEVVADFQEIVGTIILLAEPVSAVSLSRLLSISLRDIQGRLSHLHAVLSVPQAPDQPIRTLHLSFREFLVGAGDEGAGKFHICKVKKHEDLKNQCLRVLSEPRALHQDILNLKKPGIRRGDISEEQVSRNITEAVAYACSHWIWHLQESDESKNVSYDWTNVHQFLRQHFLHWLEVMSWLGRLHKAVTQIDLLLARVESACAHLAGLMDLLSFLYDGKRFLLRHAYVIDLAPLQLYSSGLIFSPSRSIIRRHFEHRYPQSIEFVPKPPSDWSFEWLKLESQGLDCEAITFSPDGKLVAATEQISLTLWNASIGEELASFTDTDRIVDAMAFSFDLERVAMASSRMTIEVGSCFHADEYHTLVGHTEKVTKVMFSPLDHETLVSASSDGTMLLWDISKEEETCRFLGHTDVIKTIAFSPNGQQIVTSSKDKTIRLWNVSNGREARRLSASAVGDEYVRTIVFHPLQEDTVLLGCSHGAIYVWNTKTETEIWTVFQFGLCSVRGIAFSREGRRLAIALSDGTLRLHDGMTGNEIYNYLGHTGAVDAVTFSRDDMMLASASRDGTVRLWRLAPFDEETQSPTETKEPVEFVCLSDSQTAVSGWGLSNSNMSVWNATTGEQTRDEFLPLFNISTARKDLTVDCTALSADGQTMALALSDGTLRLYDLANDTQRQKLVGYSNCEISLATSADGHVIASTLEGELARRTKITVWNGPRIERFHISSAICFSQDGQLIALASNETESKPGYWNRDKASRKKLDDLINAHAFFPDGQKVVSSPLRNTVWLWDTDSGNLLQKFEYQDRIFAITISPDSRILASASYRSETELAARRTNQGSISSGGGVQLWNVASGQMSSSFQLGEKLEQIRFTEGGQHLDTDKGWIDLRLQTLSKEKPDSVRQPRLDVHEEWIKINHEDILWLPFEYRAICYHSQAGRLAVGHETGQATFFTAC